MSINELSQEILSYILADDLIPLAERLQLRQLSKNWCEAIEKTCRDETTLAIYGSGGCGTNKELVITEDKFNVKSIKNLANLFENISELTLETSSKQRYQLVSKVLEPYRTTLTSLSLIGFNEGHAKIGKPFEATRRLVTALNSLPNLKSLALANYRLTKPLLEEMAPTLARLGRFAFKTDYAPINCELLGQTIFSGLSNNCTHLMLPAEYLHWPASMEVDTNLAHLIILNYPAFHDAVCRFRTLRTLKIDFGWNHLTADHLRDLVHLTQLTTLQFFNVNYLKSALEPPVDQVDRPLGTVKRLYFNCSYRNSKQSKTARAFLKQLVAWFPRLETLTVQSANTHQPFLRMILDAISKDGRFQYHLESIQEMTF